MDQPLDPRSLDRLRRMARFRPHAPAFYQGVEYEVVRRFYRRSRNAILYDLRDYRNGRILADIPDGDLRTPLEEREAVRRKREHRPPPGGSGT